MSSISQLLTENNPYINSDSERGYNMAGYFPEATRNYLLGLTLDL